MQTRRIGSLDVSILSLGCNNFGMRIDEAATIEVVNAALDAGINYFDNADIYGGGKSEEMLGVALKTRRNEAIVATKFGGPSRVPEGRHAGEASWVREACDRSLTALGMDRIDHLQMHYPDPITPIEETLGALNELVVAGKVGEIGCSNFSADMLASAHATAATKGFAPFRSVQNHYSMLKRDPESDGVLDACGALDIAFVPYFPLESGVLSGKYTLGQPLPAGSRLEAWGRRASAFIDDDRLRVVQRLDAFAHDHGHTILDLALCWLAAQPAVATIIAGATSPDQVRANAAAAQSWTLTDDDLASIDAILAP